MVPHHDVDGSDLELVGGVGELPALLAHPGQRPGATIGAAHLESPPREVVVLGVVRHRDRSQQAHPETGVAQQSLTAENHLDHHVGAPLLAARFRVADPTEVPPHLVAEPFQRGGEDRAVLEAVATTTTTDELLLDGAEGDAGVLAEQHVDVVEGERTHVRLVQLRERRAARARVRVSRGGSGNR